MKKWKSFSKWTTDEVEETFQLTPHLTHPTLTAWLTPEVAIAEDDHQWLAKLQQQLIANVHYWNEQELQIKFIGRLLNRIDFDQPHYKAFYEREISAVYQHQELSGLVDFVVAEGRGVPKAPYFFLHEHKRDADSSNDPRGQLLVSMVAAQILNQQHHPIYGVYVIGRAWYFTILQQQDYALSLAYDATKDEIYQLYGILQRTRQIIDTLVK